MFCERWEPNRDEDSAQRDSKVVLDESTNLIELVSEKGKLASYLTTLYPFILLFRLNRPL